jgi:hypothetical protein
MRRLVLVFALVCVWWWWRHDDRSTSNQDAQMQGAVLADGFAFRSGDHVHELDFAGKRRAKHLVRDDRDFRVFGTRAGAAAAWLQSGKLQLFNLKRREVVDSFGKAATALCDGVATNEYRFAVGWVEKDDGVWFVHGPTRRSTASIDVPVHIAATMQRPWCAIASAEDLIGLAWRERNWLRINWCSSTRCSPTPAAVKLPETAEIIGLGCLRTACLLATRDGTATSLAYVTESGAVKWRQDLTSSSSVLTIIGIADTAFAVALPNTVVRIDRKGARSELWAGEGHPAIAWSRGRLLIAHKGGETVIEVLR